MGLGLPGSPFWVLATKAKNKSAKESKIIDFNLKMARADSLV